MPKLPATPTVHTYSARVEIGDERFYYSYNTLVAYETRPRTTTRNLKRMGVNWFEQVPMALFLDLIAL